MGKIRKLLGWFMLGLAMTLIVSTVSCGSTPSGQAPPTRLTIGLVSYDEGAQDLEKYQRFQTYLAEQLNAVVELEPVFNEIRALEQIQARRWSLVFAPSGLAAIAISEAQYVPLFPLQGTLNQTSVLVVQDKSSITALQDLQNKTVALGEIGSATGYYLPLYDLYGLTLEAIQFAPTPKAVLNQVAADQVAAGALAEEMFQAYRGEFEASTFRVLHESRSVPPGAVLLSPNVERNQQRLIEEAMGAAPSTVTADAAYVPNSSPPDLSQLIDLVDKVRPLETRVKETPAVLTLEQEATGESTN